MATKLKMPFWGHPMGLFDARASTDTKGFIFRPMEGLRDPPARASNATL